jgi:signal peptidase I
MNFNFELILFYLVIISGVIALIDIIFLAKKRKQKQISKLPMLIDYAWSFFPVLLIVFLLRSFLFEPFRIPSGSLQPSLLIGDFILVNKYDYGVRLPIVHTKIWNVGEPKRGDIFVFRWPPNPSVLFIKRVIGIPGDHISYVNKILTINGQRMSQEYEKNTTDYNEYGNAFDVIEKNEDLMGLKHYIYQLANDPGVDFNDIVVPPHMYFAMGDNRDNSADSRTFGFVPEQNIVGKAVASWMSWDPLNHTIRWNRIGKLVH